MLKKAFNFMLMAAVVALSACNSSDVTPDKKITFDHLELDQAESAWYGQDESGEATGDDDLTTYHSELTADIATVNNYFHKTPAYGYWGSYAYSNQTADTSFDPEEKDKGTFFSYQFVAVGSNAGQYLVYNPGFSGLNNIEFNQSTEIKSISVNNLGVTYLSIMNGDGFAKKFEDGDWFKVTFTGLDAEGKETGAQDFYLADYRDGKTDVVSNWTNVDLSGLGAIKELKITFDGSDQGDNGLNTPKYLAIKEIAYQ
ncbi:DUF4465 domain-containing protein [Persicobacter psychrovividus]